jgi:hypothetical protein
VADSEAGRLEPLLRKMAPLLVIAMGDEGLRVQQSQFHLTGPGRICILGDEGLQIQKSSSLANRHTAVGGTCIFGDEAFQLFLTSLRGEGRR